MKMKIKIRIRIKNEDEKSASPFVSLLMPGNNNKLNTFFLDLLPPA